MNSISINGSISSTIGSLVSRGDLNTFFTPTGSNVVSDAINIGTDSYSGLPTSSLSDIRYTYFKNEGNGKVFLAKDSSGTNIISIMRVGDVALIPMSGSNSLYAKAETSASVLTMILNEN